MCTWCTEIERYSGVIRLISLTLELFLDYYLKDLGYFFFFLLIKILNSYWLIYISHFRNLYYSFIKHRIESKVDISYRKESIFVSSKFLRLKPTMNPRVDTMIIITGKGLTTPSFEIRKSFNVSFLDCVRLDFIGREKRIQPLSSFQ